MQSSPAITRPQQARPAVAEPPRDLPTPAIRLLAVGDFRQLRHEAAAADCGELVINGVADGAVGLELALRRDRHDAILLDIRLPGIDGLRMIQKLRGAGITTPIIVTSAPEELEHRVVAMKLGANDYVLKPFVLADLVPRLRTVTHRAYAREIVVGDLVIHLATKTARRGGEPINLSKREFELLSFLGRKSGTLVTRQMVIDGLYPDHPETTSNVIDVYIGYLRRKLNAGGRRNLIHTRRGFGYILAADPRLSMV